MQKNIKIKHTTRINASSMSVKSQKNLVKSGQKCAGIIAEASSTANTHIHKHKKSCI